MKTKKDIFIKIVIVLLVVVLLMFLGSSLKPYIPLVLAILLLLSGLLYYKKKESKFFKGSLIVIFILSVLYIIFPVKIIYNNSMVNDIYFKNRNGNYRLMNITYGLPTPKLWEEIEKGNVFTGGDVFSWPFAPRHVILVR